MMGYVMLGCVSMYDMLCMYVYVFMCICMHACKVWIHVCMYARYVCVLCKVCYAMYECYVMLSFGCMYVRVDVWMLVVHLCMFVMYVCIIVCYVVLRV